MTEGGQPNEITASTGSPAPRDRIRISKQADDLLEQWASDVYHGNIEFWQLPTGLRAFWDLAFVEGSTSRQPEIDRAQADADRYYHRLYNPSRELKPAPDSYAELERRRGNPENAERYEKWLNDLLGDFGRSTA